MSFGNFRSHSLHGSKIGLSIVQIRLCHSSDYISTLILHPFILCFFVKEDLIPSINFFSLVFIVLFFLPTTPSYNEKKELPVLVIIDSPMLTRVLALNRYSKIIH